MASLASLSPYFSSNSHCANSSRAPTRGAPTKISLLTYESRYPCRGRHKTDPWVYRIGHHLFTRSSHSHTPFGNVVLEAIACCALAASGKTGAAGAAGCTFPGTAWRTRKHPKWDDIRSVGNAQPTTFFPPPPSVLRPPSSIFPPPILPATARSGHRPGRV